ncbi:reverse transcriptase domain-containing protein [Citrus sinensis]|nr:reverse transcriptase domain-containing protein [Citrus sinensis]
MESVSELAKKDPPPLEGDRSAKKAKFRIEGDDEDNPPLVSFKDKLMETHDTMEEDLMGKEDDLVFDLEDVVIETEGHLPSISFSQKVHAQLVKPWRTAVVIKLLGRTIGYKFKTEGVAWIRLPGMPHHYYHKRILRMLGQVIGKVIKIDYNTESPCRGKFARIAVELDLAKPLCSQFLLDGKLQKVEYENLPLICYECGKYSHLSITCLERTSNEEDTHGAELSLRSGVSSKGFRRTFKGFVKNYTPTMVAILEPTDSGFFGEEEFAVEVTVNHRQFIHFRVSDNGGIISSITAVYASLIPSMRKHLWSELDKLASFVQEPWILGGDFNVILNASEKRGGSRRTNSVCQLFNGWFQRNQLCDLEFKGPSFTWTRGSVYKRLDRAICNDKWVENFPNASMLHLPKVCSDHRPILVRFEKIQSACSSPKPFRFLASSLTDKRFESLVSSIWQPDMNYLQSAKHFVEEASLWNSNVFGNIFKRKNRLLVRIGGIQQALETHHSNNLIRLECQLKKELEEVLTQEELLRYQKSRREWIQCGDRNTSFFHRKTIQRRRRNRIEMIKDDMGNWLLDNNAIKEYVVSYFSKLYTKEDEFYKPYPIRNAFPVFERSQLQGFSLAVDDEEIKNVVFCMKALKAKGIDSLHALFYQTQWNVVGNSVCKLIKDIFSGTEVPKELNRTLLVLIPKSDNPTSLKLFRPISLCPVIYKTIIKLLANRLKAIMPELIGPNQTSFVPRRHITENIVIAQEVIHSIR